MSKKLESYVNIQGGKILMTKTNRILAKIYISSDLHGTFDSIACFIKLISADGTEKTLESSEQAFEVTEGNLTWEFLYDCVRIRFDIKTFI